MTTALVTGASSGIGAATARALSAAGHVVIAAARRLEALEELCASLDGPALAVAMDVTDPASVTRGLEEARPFAEAHGGISWLVNNAGAAESAPVGKTDDALTERMLEVNFHGARRLTEALAPVMVEAGGGAVVNVASSAGLHGYAYVTAYCAAKHALVGYSRAAAAELGEKGVRISLVCPHYVDTPMTDASAQRLAEKTGKSEEELRAFFASQNPGGRLVTAGEVAGTILELLSEGESGSLVELDGSGDLPGGE
ncbi:MAG: SDR family oxidoreductase [Planctomycetes bacterium]|nr:SDR family oxidoreductase [Planctomycetota bacterium]